MIPYEKALKFACRELKEIDFCEEYKSAWLFGMDEKPGRKMPANHTVVIMKDNGDSLTLMEYLEETNYNDGKAIKSFDIK